MTNLMLRKAERKQSRLRIGMAGPSGSGKTYSALKMARGLVDSWDKIAMIDTENKRGDLYSHLGEYNIITLEAPFTPERFIEAIKACENAGMEVIIIDSSSHEWDGPGGCLELNDKLAATKFKGNTWAAWSETTPRHQKFIEAIIASPCHIITTMRSKTDTIQTEDKKIKKVGLKEIQREGFEYELTVSFNIDRDNHYAMVGKDNTELFGKSDPFLIDIQHGQMIRDWNQGGAVDYKAIKQAIMNQLKRLMPNVAWTKETVGAAVKELTGLELTEANYIEIESQLKQRPTPEPVATPEAPDLPFDEPKKPETTVEPQKTPESKIEPPKDEPEPEPEADQPFEPVSAGNIQVIRAMLKEKQAIDDDENVVKFINFFYDQAITKIDELDNRLGKKIAQDLINGLHNRTADEAGA